MILITGAAGFIGFSLVKRLLLQKKGKKIIGIDNINAYYDPILKKNRLKELERIAQEHAQPFEHILCNIADWAHLENVLENKHFDCVVHLAAQAGVRYCMVDPQTYTQSNLVGFANILEICRLQRAPLYYASSSSVYGKCSRLPFSEDEAGLSPLNFYAATKQANESMAASYRHLYGLTCTGLRFFTVYGPWGRPDMALFSFTKHILQGNPITLYNNGHMARDFTYIEDIIDGVIGFIEHTPVSGDLPLYNLGSGRSIALMTCVRLLEEALGRKATCHFLPRQESDMHITQADISAATNAIGYTPHVAFEDGIFSFVDWYRWYHGC